MDLANFQLQTAIFEVRYDHALLLWDRAGSFWHWARQAHPTLKVIEAAPSRVTASIERQYQIALEINRFAVELFPPARMEDYIKLCGNIFGRAAILLELDVLTRVGIRLVYRQTHRSKDETAKAMLETGIIKVPSGTFFGIQGRIVQPMCSVSWEGEKLGALVQLRTQERKLVVDPPIGENSFERIEKEVFEFDFDVDYFTIAPIEREIFRASDWLQQAVRVIRRDSGSFVGG
jgi:hypothetical protein